MAASRDRSFTVSTTVLYLLVPLLISETVGTEISNFTEDLFGVLIQTVTSRPKDNGTISNVTLNDDDLTKIKVENNNNVTVITEDDESFQDWENEWRLVNCNENLLIEFSHGLCGAEFYTTMSTVSKDKWCILDEIKGPYNEMTLCLENLSGKVGCFYPNPIVQELFLEVHSHFFQDCVSGGFVDPPESVVLTLTLIPVSLIPALVYVLIRKNKTHK